MTMPSGWAGGNSTVFSNAGTAKAWVNFNGTGTVAIRASFNVSSITDAGTGNYVVNFTTAMVDSNYFTTVAMQPGAALNPAIPLLRTDGSGFYSTTQVSVGTWNQNAASLSDTALVCVAVFR